MLKVQVICIRLSGGFDRYLAKQCGAMLLGRISALRTITHCGLLGRWLDHYVTVGGSEMAFAFSLSRSRCAWLQTG